MTPEELEAEIKSLRQQQEDQKRNWFRWGLASFGIFTVLYIVIGIKMAITGADPPPPMMFIALTFLFLGLVFTTTGRPIAFRFWFRRK
jgi:succinate-acetate transporter protein